MTSACRWPSSGWSSVSAYCWSAPRCWSTGLSEIAEALGVSEVVIGVTIVAFGTSLPELAVSLASALKGEYGLAIGNIVGSNIFNLLAVIGVAATIAPSALAPSVLSLHIFVMVAFTLVLFAMTYDYDGKAELSRLEGVGAVHRLRGLQQLRDRAEHLEPASVRIRRFHIG